MGCSCHWAIVNVPISDSESRALDFKCGQELLNYHGVGAPACESFDCCFWLKTLCLSGTGLHRYIFFVCRQTTKIVNAQVSRCADCNHVRSVPLFRMDFNMEKCVQSLSLSKPIGSLCHRSGVVHGSAGANFYRSGYDGSCKSTVRALRPGLIDVFVQCMSCVIFSVLPCFLPVCLRFCIATDSYCLMQCICCKKHCC